MRACDCTPTLNDSQVVEFCKNGFLMLEDVVPEEINRRTVEYADANPSGSPPPPPAMFHAMCGATCRGYAQDHLRRLCSMLCAG